MDKKSLPEWLFTAIILAAACALSLILRIVLPHAAVFDGQWIKLTGIDAYFYMRMVDNLVVNFPNLYGFDPYLLFPGGFFTAGYPAFFAYLLAGTIKLLGFASPGQQTADTIAVYVPAVLGMLTVIPVYFIGRALGGRWAGLAAAVLTAIMPGELLSRSLLGNTDHHAAEVLLTSCIAAFFILAVKHGRQSTHAMLTKGLLPLAGSYLLYSLAAGIFLGLYLITWSGALLFVFIMFIYFIAQFISDHLRGLPTDYLSKIAIACFLVAFLIYLPTSSGKLTLLALAIIMLTPITLNMTSAIMSARRVNRLYFPAAVAAMAGLGALAVWLLFPELFQTATYYVGSIFSWRTGQNVVGEMKSLFFPGGTFTLEMAWSQFGLIFYTGLAGLALLVSSAIRRGKAEAIFVSVWGLMMMLAAFGMVRFASYFSICLALATGYLAAAVIEWSRPREEPAGKKHRKKPLRTAAPARASLRLAIVTTAVCIVLIAVAMPGAAGAANMARSPGHTPSNAWMEALDWMRSNTQEPFGDADFYYSLYDTPAAGKHYSYPASAYGVVAWSDYGYWITRIGHRMPTANPGTYPLAEARYFTAQDENATLESLKKWQARYIVIDNRITSPNDKFYALANLSNKKESDFYELCWQQKEGKYVPLLVFYPEFYRSMVIRLYNFNGAQVTPQNTLVMSYQERLMPDGQKFTEITGLNNFRSYTEAEAFIAGQKDSRYKIIGTDPLASPVPLEELSGYRLAHASEQKATAGSTPMPEIKIFEYTGK